MRVPFIFSIMFLAAACCLGQAGPGSEKHVLATQIFENSRRAKSWLDERGVLGQLTLVNDWSSSFRSGTDSVHSFNRYSLDLLVGFDAQKAFGWKGSSGLVRVKHHLGEHGGDYVGDAQDSRTLTAHLRPTYTSSGYNKRCGRIGFVSRQVKSMPTQTSPR